MSDLVAGELEAIRGRHDDCHADWCAYHAEGQRDCDVIPLLARVGLLVERNQQLEAENEQLKRVAAERAAWLHGDRCNCGYGGFHEPGNPRCQINQTVDALTRQELADDC